MFKQDHGELVPPLNCLFLTIETARTLRLVSRVLPFDENSWKMEGRVQFILRFQDCYHFLHDYANKMFKDSISTFLANFNRPFEEIKELNKFCDSFPYKLG